MLFTILLKGDQTGRTVNDPSGDGSRTSLGRNFPGCNTLITKNLRLWRFVLRSRNPLHGGHPPRTPGTRVRLSQIRDTFERMGSGNDAHEVDQHEVDQHEVDQQLPLLPGFREMALRRMAEERRRLVTDLTAERQAARLSQTEVAARMGTSQSAVARLESGEADARASTLERYAAAIGCQITWRLQDSAPPARREDAPDDDSARG
jgi:ribosome-binding protein aMBF1 (putative translation factor)